MTGRATLLPVGMVVIIGVLALIAIASGRSNAPDVTADQAYPHYVCTFTEYCAGDSCTRTPVSFVLYLTDGDGNPRIDWAPVEPRAQLSELPDLKIFETSGGAVDGSFTVNSRRGVNFVGSADSDGTVIEHYGAGQCERLHTP